MVDFRKVIQDAKEKLIREQTKKTMLENALSAAESALSSHQTLLLNTEKARLIVQAVANKVQKDLEYRITNIVTMALSAVFTDPYEFKVEFVTRRNQTECDMYFVRDGNDCDPMDSSGGGALDIASLALRMAIWSIKKTRAIMILDEPAKFLSRDMQDKASEMLKELSDKLGIQMVVISHIPEMISAADRVINVENINGVSKVRVL
jgi:DNA repair exonuclease SbcCD ATPase subunit